MNQCSAGTFAQSKTWPKWLVEAATLIAVCAALVACGSSNNNPSTGSNYVATLTPAQETPPTGSGAAGTATFTVSADKTQLQYSVTHSVSGGNAAHLHTGGIGVAGPITIGLNYAPGSFTGSATITQQNATDIEAGRMYVNIHNTANPGGDIRGQVIRQGEVLYMANLRGANEVPPNASQATAQVGCVLNAGGNQLSCNGTMNNITPTIAHVHKAAAGVNGDIFFPLNISGPALSATQTFTAANVTDLNNNQFYANVHTVAFPNGEIRDQLRKQ